MFRVIFLLVDEALSFCPFAKAKPARSKRSALATTMSRFMEPPVGDVFTVSWPDAFASAYGRHSLLYMTFSVDYLT
jgi:hypothetical protein